ncbi:type 1 glutamine amidotransferase domain-containing protein [Pseudoalteromonas sp. T1lg65]|uniref:type 1 glutamine amidotransferase domain-containing protein n=1 Tax=Pseudoalteromonas sp. T1lg65 TaxID=2077101 RepID=UPI003F79B70D
MFRTAIKLPLIISLSAAALSTQAMSNNEPHVVMVLSSHGKLDAKGEMIQPGYEFDELSKAYAVFKANGVKVTLASPSGGKLVADNYDKEKAYNQLFLEDEKATSKLENTIKLEHIKAADVDAVFVVGGKGPMFDLATNTDLQSLIRKIYEKQGVIGAVCHGPVALVDVKLSDGEYLVKGKRVNGFTNEEEQAFSKKWAKQFPYFLEDKLKERGAQFEQDGLMLNQVTIDGQLITGQNPFSTADTARAMVKSLGINQDKSPKFKDDETILLVEAFFKDPAAAKQKYQTNQADYDPMMLAMFGLYQAKHANTEHELNTAITIMDLSLSTLDHPMLHAELARAHIRKNDTLQAQKVVQKALKKHTDSALLKELNNALNKQG